MQNSARYLYGQGRLFVWIALAGLTASCASNSFPSGNSERQEAVRRPVADGICPKLTGLYKVFGQGTGFSGNQFRASIFPTKTAEVSSYMVVSMSVIGALRLDAIDSNGVALASLNFDSTQGWYCSEGRFVKYVERPQGGEGNIGEIYEIVSIHIGESGSLCRSYLSAVQRRSILLFGGKIGAPEISRNGSCYPQIIIHPGKPLE